jgi:hypothetical protein
VACPAALLQRSIHAQTNSLADAEVVGVVSK